MMSSWCSVALTLVAAITVSLPEPSSSSEVSLQSQEGQPTDGIDSGNGSPEPPTVLLLTANDVRDRGGRGTCRWRTGSFSDCSTTCEGVSTRDVFCGCTLSDGSLVRATTDNCDLDDMRLPPLTQRQCGVECPATTPPPTTAAPTTTRPPPTTQEPTTEEPTTPEPTTREPRQCNLTECQAASDCYDDECCLQVTVKKSYAVEFYCFPLLQADDLCDLEANWTCPCGAGLECRDDTEEDGDSASRTSRTRRSSKTRDKYYKYRPLVVKKYDDECPTLYKKKQKKPKYHTAVCEPVKVTSDVTAIPVTSVVSNLLTTGVVTTSLVFSDLRPPATVLVGGGSGTCRWETGLFSDCSSTRNGIETRDVFCVCTLTSGQVKATEDNCVRDTRMTRPIQSRGCGVGVCEPLTGASASPNPSSASNLRTTGTVPTLLVVPDLRPPAVVLAQGGRGSCEWETGVFSDCSAACNGISIREVVCVCTLSSGEVRATEDNCASDTCQSRPVQSQGCGQQCPRRTEILPTTQPLPTNQCNVTSCVDQSDCDADECCLEVQYKERQKNSVLKNFCIALVDEGGACDPNVDWSCPCNVGLECMENGRSKSNGKSKGKGKGKDKRKSKNNYAKYYRPEVTLKTDDECPTLKAGKKKNDKYVSTCMQPSPGRQGREVNKEKTEGRKTVVFFADLN